MNKEQEEELQEIPTKESEKKPMGDIKFMTAGDFIIQQQEDKYVYPGSDCQE